MTVTMLWAVKGGSGTTTVAVTLALSQPGDCVLVDLDDDLPSVLGITEPSGPGIADWLQSATPASALDGLTIDVRPDLRLLPRGTITVDRSSERWGEFIDWATSQTTVIVDAGTAEPPAALQTREVRSLLVTRACYLALRDAIRCGTRPDGIVLINEPGRALRSAALEGAIGRPVVAEVPIDPAIARAIDAGLLAARCPPNIQRALRDVVPATATPDPPLDRGAIPAAQQIVQQWQQPPAPPPPSAKGLGGIT